MSEYISWRISLFSSQVVKKNIVASYSLTHFGKKTNSRTDSHVSQKVKEMTRTGPEQHRSYAEEWCHSLSTVSLRCLPGVNLPSEAARPGATQGDAVTLELTRKALGPLERFLWGTVPETFSSSTAVWLSIKVASAEMSNYLEFLWILSVPFLIFPVHLHSCPPLPTVCSLRIPLCNFCDALRHAAKFLRVFISPEPVLHVEDPPSPQERETHTVNSNRKHSSLLDTWEIVWTISETYHFPLKPAMTRSQTAPQLSWEQWLLPRKRLLRKYSQTLYPAQL